jgi:hypothetical protein
MAPPKDIPVTLRYGTEVQILHEASKRLLAVFENPCDDTLWLFLHFSCCSVLPCLDWVLVAGLR